MSKESEQREAGVSASKHDLTPTFSCIRWSQLTGKTVSPSDARAWRKRSQMRARTASTIAEIDAVDVLPVRLLPTMARPSEYHEALGLSPVVEQAPTRPNQLVGRVYANNASLRDRKQQLRKQQRGEIKDKIYLPAMASRSQPLRLSSHYRHAADAKRDSPTLQPRATNEDQYLARPRSAEWIGACVFNAPPGIRLLSADLPELRARLAQHGHEAGKQNSPQHLYCPTPPLSARIASPTPPANRSANENHRRPPHHNRAQYRQLKTPNERLTVSVHFESTATLSVASTGSLEADIVNALEALEKTDISDASPVNESILKNQARELNTQEEGTVHTVAAPQTQNILEVKADTTEYRCALQKHDSNQARCNEAITIFDLSDDALVKESTTLGSLESISLPELTPNDANLDKYFSTLLIEDVTTTIEPTKSTEMSGLRDEHGREQGPDRFDRAVDSAQRLLEDDSTNVPFISLDKNEHRRSLATETTEPDNNRSQDILEPDDSFKLTASSEVLSSSGIDSNKEEAQQAMETSSVEDGNVPCTSEDNAQISRFHAAIVVEAPNNAADNYMSSALDSQPPPILDLSDSASANAGDDDEYSDEDQSDGNDEATHVEIEAEFAAEDETKREVNGPNNPVNEIDTPSLPGIDEQLHHSSIRRPSVSAYDADFEDEEEDTELLYYEVDEEY